MTAIAIFISLVSYHHDSFNYGFRAIISELINHDNLNTSTQLIKWGSHIKLELFYLIIVRLLAMTCFTTAAIPFGTILPGFVIGCFMGRFFGEVLHCIYPFAAHPTIFAFCGTAAFIASINHAFSITIIVLEMSGRF